MKFITLTVGAILGLSLSSSIMAATCSPATSEQATELTVATGLNLNSVVDNLLTNFCPDTLISYNTKKAPVFWMYNTTMLNLFLKHNIDITAYQKPPIQADILSYLLIRPYVAEKLNLEEKNKAISVLKPVVQVSLAQFDRPEQVLNIFDSKKQLQNQENKDLINKVATIVTSQTNNYHDKFFNIDLHYAIAVKNAEVTKMLVNGNGDVSRVDLFKANSDFITPLHLMFEPNAHRIDTTGQKTLNDYVILKLNKMDEKRLLYVSLDGLNFFEFATLMKNNNPDFYNQLMSRYPASKKSMESNDDDLVDKFNKKLDFVQKMKYLLN